MKKNSYECVLCYEVCEISGIGKCNHRPICYKCIYKLRAFSKTNVCPICNVKNIEKIKFLFLKKVSKLRNNFDK